MYRPWFPCDISLRSLSTVPQLRVTPRIHQDCVDKTWFLPTLIFSTSTAPIANVKLRREQMVFRIRVAGSCSEFLDSQLHSLAKLSVTMRTDERKSSCLCGETTINSN